MKFSEAIGAPFSFERADLAEMVRNFRHGGITTILSNRHVEISVDPSERVFSIEVYTVPNGDLSDI